MSPLRLDLDSAALTANWRLLARRSGAAACGAAIKADGYGLGAAAVIRRLAAAGCRDFFVANWGEAAALGPLPGGVSLSVLHGVRADDMELARTLAARPVLNSAAQVARWRDAGGGTCDIMVDTGMNRLGLSVEEACSGLLDGVDVDLVMSHLACAEERDHPLNARQLGRFVELRGRGIGRRHSLANSGGIFLGPDYAFDLTRPGLALYGGVPVPNDPDQQTSLRRVVTVRAAVLQVRSVEAGESVGYGATWRAPERTRVAILNIGYADGLLRRVGAALGIRHDNSRLPLVGRVSMDLVAVDLGEAPVVDGDWLTLDWDLPALARASGLSQYELLVGLGARFDREWRD
jgi:alanine racemase